MPSIDDGGVEKNLFIISNFFSKHLSNLSLITLSRQYKKKFNKNIKFITPKHKFWNNLGRRKKFIIALCLLMIEILKNRNVLVFSFQGNIYCTLLCKILGVKVIIRSNSAPEGWGQSWVKYYGFRYILKFANLIIVNSKDFKKKLKLKYNLNAVGIYNPLNLNEIKFKANIQNKYEFPPKKIKMINIGRIVEQKDQLTLLKALKYLGNKIEYFLYIVGSGKEKSKLEKFIKNNKLKKNVKILNYQRNPYNLLKKSNLFVLTSIYEGLPNVLLEAAALKKFIIAADCPTGPREILSNGKGGILFKPKDYKSLANKILEFSNNKKKYKKKISYAYEQLKRFDSEIILSKYLTLIKKLL